MVRQRKKKIETCENVVASPKTTDAAASSSTCWKLGERVIATANVPLGVAIMFVLAYQYAVFNNTLHENQLWFMNIKVSKCISQNQNIVLFCVI